MFQPNWATLLTLGLGAATWFVVAIFGGRREAWDSGVVSYFAPWRFWRWALFPFLAQAVVMTAESGSGGAGLALLPLGLILFGISGAFCTIPAAIGAVAGRKAATR